MKYLHMEEGDVRPHVSELVINWHLTEAWNYKCRYRWLSRKLSPEVK